MFITNSLVLAIIVFSARLCDVCLGTLRHAMIIRGHKYYAFMIAFFEAIIWIFAVSRVISSIQDPITSFSFALGFASGTYVGMIIEGMLKIGEQVIRVFSRKGNIIAEKLREKGYPVTVFEGTGRDGIVKLLFVQTKRRTANKITEIVRNIDSSSFIILDDIRTVYVTNRNKEGGINYTPPANLVTNDET